MNAKCSFLISSFEGNSILLQRKTDENIKRKKEIN